MALSVAWRAIVNADGSYAALTRKIMQPAIHVVGSGSYQYSYLAHQRLPYAVVVTVVGDLVVALTGNGVAGFTVQIRTRGGVATDADHDIFAVPMTAPFS